MRRTVQQLLAEYGGVAVVVYFAIFFATLFGFWAAIRAGWKPTSVGGGVGTFTAAYIATKLTQPLRIAATIALTPVLARLRHRGDVVPAEPPTDRSTDRSTDRPAD